MLMLDMLDVVKMKVVISLLTILLVTVMRIAIEK